MSVATPNSDSEAAGVVRLEWQSNRHALLKDGWQRARSAAHTKSFLWIALSITAQALMASSRTVFDVFMTSSLGFEDVAVVGYGSRIFFIQILLVLGICNGAGVVVAQYYGGGNEHRAREAIGTTMLVAFSISTLGFLMVLGPSRGLAAWSSDDPAIQRLTLEYLVPASAMVLPYSIAFSIAVGLRSVGRPGLATWAAIVGLISNAILNYALIFGNFGAPALGVRGAAYASVLSFAIEAVVIAACALIYFDKRLFAPSQFGAYLNLDTIRKTLRIGLPIAFGSVIWAVSIFMYSVITAQAGPQALAVLALVTPIESTAIAVMIGVSSTANVIVGQALSRGDFRSAAVDAISLVFWTICAAVLMGAMLSALKPALLWLYAGAGTEVLAIAEDVFDVLACVLILRAINVTLVVGVLRGRCRYDIADHHGRHSTMAGRHSADRSSRDLVRPAVSVGLPRDQCRGNGAFGHGALARDTLSLVAKNQTGNSSLRAARPENRHSPHRNKLGDLGSQPASEQARHIGFAATGRSLFTAQSRR